MSWDSQLQEYMIDTGSCSAAALAQMTDGAIYAAAPTADEAGWALVFKDPHEQKILQDDGATEKAITIDDFCAAKVAHGQPKDAYWWPLAWWHKVHGSALYGGGGVRRRTCKLCFGAAPKKGVHIITTGTQILCGFYDEEKGQNSGNCKKAVLEMGVYLVGEGY